MTEGDEDSEDDGIEDTGAPPIIPGMRVWTGSEADGPPTADERARFGIPEPSAATAAAIEKIKARGVDNSGGYSPESQQNRGGADPKIITALVDKLPSFDPSWPPKTQASWFKALEKIAEMTK